MKKIIFAMAMTASTMALAYSIPASQFSVRDMKAIFTDSQISVMIGSEAIESVALIQPGVYRIQSATCSIDVRIKNAAASIPNFIGNGNYQPAVETYENQTCQ